MPMLFPLSMGPTTFSGFPLGHWWLRVVAPVVFLKQIIAKNGYFETNKCMVECILICHFIAVLNGHLTSFASGECVQLEISKKTGCFGN